MCGVSLRGRWWWDSQGGGRWWRRELKRNLGRWRRRRIFANYMGGRGRNKENYHVPSGFIKVKNIRS